VRVEELNEGEATVHFDGKAHDLKYDWRVGAAIMRGSLDGNDFVIQPISGSSLRYSLQHVGTKYDVTVQSKRQKELSAFMLPEAKVDHSNLLCSPMPGKIISVAVKAGDLVQPGQELCIVEAMKMQNVLRAAKEGTVKAVVLSPGAAVSLDQVIIEFVPDPAAEAAKKQDKKEKKQKK
jgi:propionyl-CoA carboxylase alpha chain